MADNIDRPIGRIIRFVALRARSQFYTANLDWASIGIKTMKGLGCRTATQWVTH